jgi:ligand-binding SRPBCC domain-containing protein
MHALNGYNFTMKKLTLHYSCLLNAPREEVFAFHTDTANLPRITPPWMHVCIVDSSQNHVVLDIKRHHITTRWEVDLAFDTHQWSITDTLSKGPLPFFRHHRRFLALENGATCMDESLEMVLPFGWLGMLAHPFVKKETDAMFAFRHKATQRYFEK